MKAHVDSKSQLFQLVLIFFKVLLFVFLIIPASHADVLTLAWDPPSQDPDLVYDLCYGTASNTYTACIEAGAQTSLTVENLEPGVTYYFAATATNQYGVSEYSQEINHTIPLASSDGDGDGFTENDGDCNDSNSNIHPDAAEVCGDGIDQDCSGADLACPESPENIDNDGDDFTENDGDCDDNDGSIYPGAVEICSDGIDQDCNGSDIVCPEDLDKDGDGYTENQGDCADSNPEIYPGALETCGDSIDQDCSGSDLTCPEVGDLFREAEDGIFAGAFEIVNDTQASGGYYIQVPNPTGTRFDGPDETHKMTYTFNILETGMYRIKGAVHAASGSDDSFWVQVNGAPAEGYLWDVLQNTTYQKDYVNDRDGADPVEVWLPAGVNSVSIHLREDGTRLDNIELELVVTIPPQSDEDNDGFTVEQGDCDDTDAAINPSATEICGDGIDQDCNGTDLTCPEDVDDDGDGFTENQGDCNDGMADVHPGASEICGDGIDQDCSGTDLACSEAPGSIDNDGDEFTENDGDCDDTDGSIYPGAVEICSDGIDQDCNGSDIVCPGDLDNDGDGFSENQGDCNDDSKSAYPGAGEVCGDGIDQDCSGTDAICSDSGSLFREAEEGVISGDFEIVEDSKASGGYFVHVPNKTGTRFDGPDDSHKMTYIFIISEPGTYRIKGTVYAATGSDDSFWVQVNGAPAEGFLWDVLRNKNYQEDLVNDRDGADPVEVWLPEGEHTVSVYLREDGTRLDSIELDPIAILPPESPPDTHTPQIEVGEVLVDHNWLFVGFNREFKDPVVVAGAASLNGTDPTTIRLRNVTGNGFEICLQEYEYLDGTHVSESVGYIVLERGQFSLSDGTMIESGTFTTTTPPAFERVNFSKTFNRQPVVLSAIISVNDQDAVVGRLRNVDTRGFDIKLQEQEANTSDHQGEVISYIAWEPSTGMIDGFEFLVHQTGDEITHEMHTIGFNVAFGQTPVFLCDMQTTDGGNTANLRWLNKDAYAVDILVDEEQSKDQEINHITEVVGFIGITKMVE